MQILIVGCGRVGAAVIEQLVVADQDVIVIDSRPQQLARIDHIDCQKIQGVPIDRQVLVDAGIETADAVLALSDNENINAMTAGLARSVFEVPICMLRVFNPGNVPMYLAQGFTPISQTELVMDSVLAELGFVALNDTVSVLGQPLTFTVRTADPGMIGRTVDEIFRTHGLRIFAVMAGDRPQLTDARTPIAKGDQIVLVEA